MPIRTAHVYSDLYAVPERVAAFHAAPVAERQTAVALLTARAGAGSHSVATLTSILVAGLVAGAAVMSSYYAIYAQTASAEMQLFLYRADRFLELQDYEGAVGQMEGADALVGLANFAADTLFPLLGLLIATVVAIVLGAWWWTRRSSIASAWLAAYSLARDSEPDDARRPRWHLLSTAVAEVARRMSRLR